MLFLSPSVITSESDQTLFTKEKSNKVGAIAGAYQWGPVDAPTLITNGEEEFVTKFGIPNDATAKYVMPILDFFSYSKSAWIVRQVGPTARNAFPALGVPQLIKNEDALVNATLTGVDFLAKYPGTAGNGLSVDICDSAGFATWELKGQFQYAPQAGEFAIAVVDTTGYWTGSVGGVLEKFELLQDVATAKSFNGATAYWADAINQSSKYIAVGDKTIALSNRTVTLEGGVDDNTVNVGVGFGMLKNRETYDVQFLISPDVPAAEQKAIIDIAESRANCSPLIAPPLAAVVNNRGDEVADIKAWRVSLAADSTYAFGVDNWGYMYDKYNDVYRWVPATGGTAGIMARTFTENDPWVSPAGLTRGKYKNYSKMAWTASEEDRNVLYPIGINSIVTFPIEGIVLFGDKTLTQRPSAFGHINVRWAFIVAKESIAEMARYFLFEVNDELTRAQFVNAARPFLRNMKNRRAFEDFQVVCNENNNDGEVRIQNKMVVQLLLKPTYSINWIVLNLSAVRPDVAFTEAQ